MTDGSSTVHLYLPKLATTFREGYSADLLQQRPARGADGRNCGSAPLSMAIAVGVGRFAGAWALYTRSSAVRWYRLLAAVGFKSAAQREHLIVLVAATCIQNLD